MNIRSRVREMVHGVEKTHNEKKKNNIRYQKNLPRTATNHTTMVTCDIKCPECRQGHSLEDCADFQRMSMKKRWNTVKKQRLCFQCLAPSNGMRDWDQRRNGDQSCYHPLLKRVHDKVKHTDENLITKAKNDTENGTHSDMVNEEDAVDLTNLNRSGVVSLRTVPVVLSFGDRSVETVALLDDGSTTTYVSEDIAH